MSPLSCSLQEYNGELRTVRNELDIQEYPKNWNKYFSGCDLYLHANAHVSGMRNVDCGAGKNWEPPHLGIVSQSLRRTVRSLNGCKQSGNESAIVGQVASFRVFFPLLSPFKYPWLAYLSHPLSHRNIQRKGKLSWHSPFIPTWAMVQNEGRSCACSSFATPFLLEHKIFIHGIIWASTA